ncbi:MAG TPA: hypothetical protein VG147_05760 [Solirubrobacteraceae bacterium]|nr:hypothetical protein [Solirubrobacteraceae bacterium]
MRFTVTVARRANPRVKALRGKAKDKFWEAVSRLEHEGCAAGDYRMRAPDGSDTHVCGLRLCASTLAGDDYLLALARAGTPRRSSRATRTFLTTPACNR